MRPGSGKQKGGSHEREIGGKISLWLSNGERDDLLCRTVGSGAQFTSTKRGHAGDLRSQDPLADELCRQYCIECKHWKNLFILHLLAKRGELYKALQKVRQEGIDTNRKWWLVARQNYYPDLLLMERKEVKKEDLKADIELLPDFHSFFSDLVVVYFLDEFLNSVNPIRYLLV